ncbi:MAG TPA: SCP2 sterol-binding domain-containing protein [Gaiellaceae bacterium]
MQAREFFATLGSRVDPAQLEGIDHSYLFVVPDEGRWLVEVRDGALKVTADPTEGADVEFTTSGETFDKLSEGKQNPMMAYMTGKLKINGDLPAAMKLQKLF